MLSTGQLKSPAYCLLNNLVEGHRSKAALRIGQIDIRWNWPMSHGTMTPYAHNVILTKRNTAGNVNKTCNGYKAGPTYQLAQKLVCCKLQNFYTAKVISYVANIYETACCSDAQL